MLDIFGCIFGIFELIFGVLEVTGFLFNLILTPVDWMWRMFVDDRGLFPDRTKNSKENANPAEKFKPTQKSKSWSARIRPPVELDAPNR